MTIVFTRPWSQQLELGSGMRKLLTARACSGQGQEKEGPILGLQISIEARKSRTRESLPHQCILQGLHPIITTWASRFDFSKRWKKEPDCFLASLMKGVGYWQKFQILTAGMSYLCWKHWMSFFPPLSLLSQCKMGTLPGLPSHPARLQKLPGILSALKAKSQAA